MKVHFYSILPVKIILLLLLLAEFYIWLSVIFLCHWSFCAIVIISTVLRVKTLHYSYIIVLVKNTFISNQLY